MLLVPLTAVPSQLVTTILNGQSVSLSIYQLGFPSQQALYIDVTANGAAIATCRKCRAFSGLTTDAPPFVLLDARYQPFEGDFLFLDTQGVGLDPQYSGFGTNGRWQLLYFTPEDLAALGDPTEQAAAA